MATATTSSRRSRSAATTGTMSRSRALLAMTRPSQIALVLVILANGLLLGRQSMTTPTPGLATLVAVAGLTILAAASIHLANEAADHQTDRLSERTPFSGGSGALAAGGLHQRVPLVLALTLAGATVLGALAATAGGSLPPLAAGLLLLGLIGGLAYSLPPVAAMRHGWGEPLNALLGGLLLPLTGVAAITATLDVLAVIAFLPFTFVAFASVLTTAWPDRAADAATGKDTLQVRLRPATLRRIQMAATAAFFGATLLSAAVGAMPSAVVGLAVSPLLIVGAIGYTRRRSPLANVAAMVTLALITTAALVIDAVRGGEAG